MIIHVDPFVDDGMDDHDDGCTDYHLSQIPQLLFEFLWVLSSKTTVRFLDCRTRVQGKEPKRNDGPRTVGMQAENVQFSDLSPAP
jgi:hypothetical protein